MKFVKNWREGWKWFSVHCMLLAFSFVQTWVWIPEDLKAQLPHKYIPWFASIAILAAFIGRFVDQNKNGNNY